MPQIPDLSEVITEIVQVGPRTVRVCAFDPQSLTEVYIVGDATRSEVELRNLAVRKLRWAIDRKLAQEVTRQSAIKEARQPPQRQGVTVFKDTLGLFDDS